MHNHVHFKATCPLKSGIGGKATTFQPLNAGFSKSMGIIVINVHCISFIVSTSCSQGLKFSHLYSSPTLILSEDVVDSAWSLSETEGMGDLARGVVQPVVIAVYGLQDGLILECIAFPVDWLLF